MKTKRTVEYVVRWIDSEGEPRVSIFSTLGEARSAHAWNVKHGNAKGGILRRETTIHETVVK